MMTVKQLLKILPFETQTRNNLLTRFDSLTSDQKLEISEVCWLMYFELIDAEIKYELEKALVEVKENKRSLDKNLYRQIEDQVYMKFMRNLRDEQEEEKINELREKIQSMMNEKMKRPISTPPSQKS